jgi:hypothetical protein
MKEGHFLKQNPRPDPRKGNKETKADLVSVTLAD